MRRLLEELFRTYHNDGYRYLYSLSHDTSISEDLASEVFLKLVKSIGTFQDQRKAAKNIKKGGFR